MTLRNYEGGDCSFHCILLINPIIRRASDITGEFQMKKVIVLLSLAISVLASQIYANDGDPWDKWGAAPFASSLEEARGKAYAAIDSFSIMPMPVKEYFKENLLSDVFFEGGKIIYLTPMMLLEQMWTGGVHSRVMNQKPVAQLPILKSPDGRPYRAGSVFETAKALYWEREYKGQSYILCLPLVCFNWCWMFGPTPTPMPDRCVEIIFNAPIGGFVRWGIASNFGPIFPSACNAQRQGHSPWLAWYGKCDDCIRTPAVNDFIREILGEKADIYHKYLFLVLGERQTLRFSTEVWGVVTYICLEYPDGSRTKGVYIRPQDWEKEQYELFIPGTFWVRDK